MNFFDRQILPAVQERVRRDWKLSDSDLGWLGTGFILLYAAVGLPLGRLADVWRRKWLLAAGVGLWSLLTLGSAFAWNFWSLFVLRLGVGVGEATCAPAATSLIGDLVPAGRRARALAVFMLGLPLGLALSFLVSGTIAERYGWQEAFYVAGLPGLLLAVAALFIADPRPLRIADCGLRIEEKSERFKRGVTPAAGLAATNLNRKSRWLKSLMGCIARRHTHTRLPSGVTLPSRLLNHPEKSAIRNPQSAFGRVLRLPTMWWLIASGALHNFNMYALGTFLASFLKRYHGASVERAGQVSGLVYGAGALGIFAAGWLGDRAFRRGVSGRLHVAWVALAGAAPCLLLALAAPPGRLWLCAAWLLPACLLMYAYYGTVYATIQDIVEPALRGTAMAVYFCAMYFLGAILGPVATGWVSDWCARRAAAAEGAAAVTELHKAVGLHDAMFLIPVLNVALVVVLFAASRTVQGDYLRLQKRLGAASDAGEV